MRDVLVLLKGCFEDYDISFSKIKTENLKQFYIDEWRVKPDVNYHLHEIETVTLFEDIEEYIDFFTPEFELNLNKKFNIVEFDFDEETKEMTINVTLLKAKGKTVR